MKNVSVFICVVLLAVSTSIALPEGKEGRTSQKTRKNREGSSGRQCASGSGFSLVWPCLEYAR